jgi:uncharacterized peroxidase-related enzyme
MSVRGMMRAANRQSGGLREEGFYMPRISRLKRDEVGASSVAIYDRTLRDRGNVPNMFRTMAHRPEIFETIIAHMDAVLNTGTLSKALKELVIVRTSQVNRTPYCLASHTTICKRLGWSDVQLQALYDADESDEFDERERVAIHLAEAMTRDPHNYSDAEFARLRSFYSEGEVVELMAAIGLFNYFNRFNDLLQMEPTQPASAEELAEAGVVPVSVQGLAVHG